MPFSGGIIGDFSASAVLQEALGQANTTVGLVGLLGVLVDLLNNLNTSGLAEAARESSGQGMKGSMIEISPKLNDRFTRNAI